MELHFVLHKLIAHYGLNAQQAARLRAWARLQQEPAQLGLRVGQGLAVLAAGLFGFGLVVWLAANWQMLGRWLEFGLLQAGVLLFGAGAVYWVSGRAPLGLLMWLCTGALLAYVGQTYQTGADPWQLFALWTLLTLPLCLGVRNDILWVPWLVVTMTGISLWQAAYANSFPSMSADHWGLTLVACSLYLALCVGMNAQLQRLTGAGIWSSRLALCGAFSIITLWGAIALLNRQLHYGITENYGLAQYCVALVVLLAASAQYLRASRSDTFGLALALFCVDVLLTLGGADMLLALGFGQGAGKAADIWLSMTLFLTGLWATALFAVSAKLVMRHWHAQAARRAVGGAV